MCNITAVFSRPDTDAIMLPTGEVVGVGKGCCAGKEGRVPPTECESQCQHAHKAIPNRFHVSRISQRKL